VSVGKRPSGRAARRRDAAVEARRDRSLPADGQGPESESSSLVTGREGLRGWSAAPRAALWLCVPALLTGVAGATILLIMATLPANLALRRAMLQATAAEGVVFALPGLVLTPIAAMIAGVITWRKKWSSQVVWTLWVTVLVSLAVVVPAANLAMASYAFSVPRPAEAPLIQR
jgi:hypothetical protein